MADNFFGFSPESFEQFVRVLALSVFGPGVTVFGNGPDGGREASFQGEVPYPYPPTTQWSGYGVIQAKCKEKCESTEKDQKWALKQLADELQTFLTSQKRDPKPEYYIFVTNVELSSTAAGGRDEADKLVRSYYGKLPLKEHAVWDANQLTGFLAKYEVLRRRFIAYLTPGDVLAAMLADIEKRRPNATRILTAFLERELRADESARLDQAGNRTEEQLRLAQLFFDLPALADDWSLPPEENPDDAGKLPPGVLWELLSSGSRKLDPKTLYDQEIASSDNKKGEFPTRYVLLGAPGSGKSTVGQFIAQIHRAALLERRDPSLLEPQSRQTIRETRALCEQEGLPWPPTPRYPFRVELNRFAKSLTSKDDPIQSLAGYMLNSLKREYYLTHEDLIEWLVTYPWILILDGLDEVPATSNRDALLKATNDFLAEARQAGADLFVVATSRQQGYGGEFAGGVTAFRHIMPLSTARALRYVERYAEARFGASDPNRAKDLVDKLRQSANRELTSQLMSSPLQVTFMATVVAARGDPGEDRWQLFDSYYRTIYDRERQKAVPPYDAVLSKQQPTIDRLHHDIGFLLQYQGETAEGTATSLPIAQFERLVDAYLSEIGREGSEKDQMVKQITDAARHRLVFLTSRIPGELSFDVRSLQEYMASECIMSGDPDTVKARLRAIAPAPYWRNVFLFAAGKCFANAQFRHLQDAIRLLCVDLNNSNDTLLASTRAGAELALDVLLSGAVAENPHHARHMAQIALSLLDQPYLTDKFKEGSSADLRLALVFRDTIAQVYREELKLRVGQVDIDQTIGAWPLIIRLIDKGESWAIGLAEKSWPAGHQAQLKILRRVLPELQHLRWLTDKLAELTPELAPQETWRIHSTLSIFPEDSGVLPEATGFDDAICYLTHRLSGTLEIPLRVCPEDKEGMRLRITSLVLPERYCSEIFAELARMPRHHPGWLPFILAYEFLCKPDRQALAQILKECVDGGWEPSLSFQLSRLPWPLAACLAAVKSVQELKTLGDQIEKGALGDFADWLATEQRWKSHGIKAEDLAQQPTGMRSFDDLIAHGGWLAKWTGLSIINYEYPDTVIKTLLSVAEQIRSGSERASFLWILVEANEPNGRITKFIDPAHFRQLFEGDFPQCWWYHNIIEYPEQPEVLTGWLEFFDWLGRSNILSPNHRPSELDAPWSDIWQREFIRNPIGLGLLRLLGRIASVGGAITMIPAGLIDPQLFSEPRFRLAAILVRLTQPDLTDGDADDLAEVAAALLAPMAESGADELLFRTAQENMDHVPAIGAFLLRLHELMPPSVDLGVAKCEHLLRLVHRRRASDLHEAGQLTKLQLPTVPFNESIK